MINIPINLSSNDLLKGVEQLEKTDLDAFVRKVLQIRARKLANSLSQEETILLEKINIGLSETERVKLEAWSAKKQEGKLTSGELSSYLALVDKMERLNNQRLEAVGLLAQMKGVSFRQMMEQLGLMNKQN